MLLVEVTEMLGLHHVGVDSAFGVSLTGFVDTALGGSIGLLWEREDIDVCCNNCSESPGRSPFRGLH